MYFFYWALVLRWSKNVIKKQSITTSCAIHQSVANNLYKKCNLTLYFKQPTKHCLVLYFFFSILAHCAVDNLMYHLPVLNTDWSFWYKTWSAVSPKLQNKGSSSEDSKKLLLWWWQKVIVYAMPPVISRGYH